MSEENTGSIYRALVRPFSVDFSVLLLRVGVGSMMATTHGWSKVSGDLAPFVNRVGAMGFPAPEFFAWAAALSEFVGGLLLILGLGTRVSSVLIAITLGVAAFIMHADDPFGKKELALFYILAAIVIFLLGPGRFSLDQRLFGTTTPRTA